MAYEPAKYTAELLDPETDEVMDVITFTARDQRLAENYAHDEADYLGFHCGEVRMIG